MAITKRLSAKDASRYIPHLLKNIWRKRDSAEPSWRLRPFWRLVGRRLGKRRSTPTSNSMLPVLIKVFAGFSKVDGEIDEQDIDSSLGFLRYDYPEAIYSELRALYSQALKESQDLNEMAAELANRLRQDEKILLGVQLYVLISRGVQLHREQLISFYLFMTNLGVASEAIDLVYQLNSDDSLSRTSEDIGQPLEVLHIAKHKPADLVVETLPDEQELLVFRFQNQILLKNVGILPVIVRGRQLRQGEFCRLYEGQRVLLADSVLDYQDLSFYFNTKKDLSSAQLYLTLGNGDQPFLERYKTKSSQLEIKFGLGISVRAIRATNASIRGERLTEGKTVDVSLNDKLIFDNQTEISFRELRHRAREMGGRFELLATKSEYLVSNNPNLLRSGDILLSLGMKGDILLRIRCDYARKRGELEVLTASHPVLVEGEPVRERERAALKDDDTITIEDGQFLRCHFSDRIIEEERNVINRIELREITHSFDQKETALDGITLTARRGEMICVIGPSGCGKSTLLRALSGHTRPRSGQVLLNGFRLYEHSESLKPYICYIPQEDAFDSLLTIQENIDYAAAIRAPNLSRNDRRRRVDAKLVELGLNERRHRLAGTPKRKHLSGGERKRLNLGMDMIGPADVYLIDEPTSGLSSKDSEHVLEIIQGLSRNKIVFVSIHQPSARLFYMFDKALLLDHGGKFAFYGTPEEMVRYFEEAREEAVGPRLSVEGFPMRHELPRGGTHVPPDFIFDVLETPLRDLSGSVIYEEDSRGHLAPARRFSPDFWRDRYQAHRTLREVKQIAPDDTRTLLHPPVLPPTSHRTIREEVTQAFTLLERAFLSKLRNRANLVTTLLEAPLLAVLIAVVLRYSEDGGYTFGSAFHIPTYLFLSLVIGMFLGLTNSADEIIRDRPLLTRERNQNVRLVHYLLSKLITLGVFAFLQSVIYLLVGNFILEIRGVFAHHLMWMFLTTMCGVTVGLVISSLVSDVKTALNIIPVILIPQIILGGALIKYEEMNRNFDLLSSMKRWTNETVEEDSPLKVPLICELMPIRWSYEGMVISQAEKNPLSKLLKEIELESARFAGIPEHSPEQERQFRALKEARSVVLGLEAADPGKLARDLRRIERSLEVGTFSASRYSKQVPEPSVRSRDVFRNKKVEDLVLRAEAEVHDHRRDPKRPLNVFFGLRKTFLSISIPTIAMNAIVLVIFMALASVSVWGILRYQLTRT